MSLGATKALEPRWRRLSVLKFRALKDGAGPTGFVLARELAARGIGCTVVPPGKIERPATGQGRSGGAGGSR